MLFFLQVKTDPCLYSSSGSNWSIIAADKTVILFDQNYQSILLLLNFGIHNIYIPSSTFTLLTASQMSVCVLSDGLYACI